MTSLVRLQQTVVLWTLCVCTSFAVAQVVFAQQATPLSQQPQVYSVGVAKVDITPDYPVRLNGFLVRKQESVGVRQQIWAKAIAIGQQADAAVLITVDALGIPDQLTATIAKRLQQKAGLNPARLAITASHTHTAPMINGCAPNIFGEPIPPDAQAHIDRYTQEFTDKLEQAALEALKDRRDSTLHWGIGLVSFAKNRRDKNGPFDHDLPMLVVRDLQSQVRAIYVSYACHCVTLSEPRIGGDWAGFAQVQIEKRYPKAIALTSVGCAGDQNPSTGVVNDRADLAQAQGEEIAVEVDRLLSTTLRPVSGPLTIAQQELQLPLDTLPTRADFERLAQENTPTGFHARVQLAKLDRGEKLREQISYPVQSWAFGDSLAMVF
ncbi:MAG: neutral/alkaline non-lysosomal ceramidase N-terminal domain-containing protein, partial [Pirellulaceae bacterium]|nr:neutral/alkaline non-lysosomal ceramidase N-terminal domain-containing protein [Pirellulaceae bacterium]